MRSTPSIPATVSCPRTPRSPSACRDGRHHLRRPAHRDPANSSATRSSPARSRKQAGVPVLSGSDAAVRDDGGGAANSRRSSAIRSSSRRRWAAAAGACASLTRTGTVGSMRWSRLGARPAPRSASPMSSWKSSFAGPGISKCNCSATSTATWSTCSNAIARCNAGIRRSSRSRRPRTSTAAMRRQDSRRGPGGRPGGAARQRRHGRVPGRCRQRRSFTSSR